MAFGDVKGTFSGLATAIPAGGVVTATPTAGFAVVYGDLAICLVSLAGAQLATGVTDNLGNTYTPHNAGTASTVGARLFWALITNAGTITTMTVTTGVTAGSTDDYAVAGVVFTGPFTSSPVAKDVNPVNATDATTPFTCTATGTLAQAAELIVAAISSVRGYNDFGTTVVTSRNQVMSSTSGAANSCSASIGSVVVAATTTQTPTWTRASGTFTGCVEQTVSFRQGFAAQALTPGLFTQTNVFYVETLTLLRQILTAPKFTETNVFYAPSVRRVLKPSLFTDANIFSRTNYVENSTMSGAVAGSPGTLPTNWFETT